MKIRYIFNMILGLYTIRQEHISRVCRRGNAVFFDFKEDKERTTRYKLTLEKL